MEWPPDNYLAAVPFSVSLDIGHFVDSYRRMVGSFAIKWA